MRVPRISGKSSHRDSVSLRAKLTISHAKSSKATRAEGSSKRGLQTRFAISASRCLKGKVLLVRKPKGKDRLRKTLRFCTPNRYAVRAEFESEGRRFLQLDFQGRELTVKLVYYGPALSGK